MGAVNDFYNQTSLPAVVLKLDQLLPALTCGHYSDQTLLQLSNLCADIKIFGEVLDMNYKEKMDEMQSIMIKICQDRQLDLTIRLQVLEFIELRTLDWQRNLIVEEYYKDRFAKLDNLKKRNENTKKEGNARKLSFPSLSSIQESTNGNDDQDCIISSLSARKYTKEDLLMLSTSSLARIAPPNWEELVDTLPPAIIPSGACVDDNFPACLPVVKKPAK